MKNRPSTHRTANRDTVEFARELRKKRTPAEQLLWERIRKKALRGFRIRQQHPIGSYIADFYCNEVGLVVEVDGGVHDQIEQKERDRLRDLAMRNHGLTILRITNQSILEDIDSVLLEIEKALLEKASNSKV